MLANRIITAAAFALAVASFVTTNSALALAACLVIAGAVVVSLAHGATFARRSRFVFDLRDACVAGDTGVALDIELERPLTLRGRVELVFEVTDAMLGETVEVPATLYPGAGTPERFSLPLDATACGRTRVRLASARTYDSLGLAAFAVPGAELDAAITVYPRIVDLDVQVVRSRASSTAGAVYDPHRRGQDRTEVFEMRDFRAGDSLKSVHWKLSARFDDLMVREPSHPADYDVALLCGAHICDPANKDQLEVLDAELSVLASISQALMRRGCAHTVAYSDGRALRYAAVDSPRSFDEALDSLMCAPLQEHVVVEPAEFEAFCAEHGVTKVIVVSDVLNESLFAKLEAVSDLAVVYVSDQDYAGAHIEEGRTFLHIPANAFGERFKNLEL